MVRKNGQKTGKGDSRWVEPVQGLWDLRPPDKWYAFLGVRGGRERVLTGPRGSPIFVT